MKNIVYKIIEHDYRAVDNLAGVIEDYDYNYYSGNNVKQLTQILNYYSIAKHKMCKDELITTIVCFENDEYNSEIVNNRKHLWSCMKEIKNDSHLCKFLIMDI
tara:strand:- start:113 stop:421 length:309 start_codon:yes stop_codon:yes gene_type:complete